MRACQNCQWWEAFNTDRPSLGECYGAPPSVIADGQTRWPLTYGSDFCGAFRIAETLVGGADTRTETPASGPALLGVGAPVSQPFREGK